MQYWESVVSAGLAFDSAVTVGSQQSRQFAVWLLPMSTVLAVGTIEVEIGIVDTLSTQSAVRAGNFLSISNEYPRFIIRRAFF